jgi:MFS family permease
MNALRHSVRKRLRRLFYSPFTPLYNEQRLALDIRRSLTAIVIANLFGNLWTIVATGPALAGYAGVLGASDLEFGFLSGIPSAVVLLQIPLAALVSRTHKRKRYMLTFGLLSRMLWIVVGLTPYFVPFSPAWLRLWSVIFLVGIASCGNALINVSWFPWLADLLPMGIRGRWLSLRDAINAITGVFFGLLIAFLLDTVPGYPGYSIVFVLGGLCGTLDMICFAFAKEVYSQPPTKVHTGRVIGQIFRDKPFLRLTLFWTAWNFTANLSSPYFNRYVLEEMGLTFTQLTVCSQIAAALTSFLVIPRWGRLLDRYGAKPVLWVACIVASLTPGFYCFSVPGSVLPTLLHNVIGAAFWSAVNLTVTNMQLSHSPDDLRPSYIAVFACMTALMGTFLGTLAGGAMIEGLRAASTSYGLSLFGSALDPYKTTFFVSVVTRLGIVLFFIPRMENEKGAAARQMIGDAVRELGRKIRLRKSA